MRFEQKEFEVAEHPGFLYREPEAKAEVELSAAPSFDSVETEIAWQQKQLAFRYVDPVNGEWDKNSLLTAIKDGHADGFSQESFQFPPIPEGTWHTTNTAYYFDDRDFGNRLANRVLEGFRRKPRTIEPNL